MYVALAIFALLGASSATCPDQDPGLTDFSIITYDITSDVEITTDILLNVADVAVNTITVSGNGRLIFKRGMDITIRTKGIVVKDNAALIIGSNDCRHEDDVTIYLEGGQPSSLHGAGEKYIAVTDQGVLQIYGQERLAWTKLAATVDRYAADPNNVEFSHLEERFDNWRWNEGFVVYKFTGTTLDSHKFFDTVRSDAIQEQKAVDAMINDLDTIQDGQTVAIALQYFFKNQEGVDYSGLYDKMEEVAGIPSGELHLRHANKWDAFSLVFVKGQTYSQAHDVPMTSPLTEATATIEHGGLKLTAVSKVYRNSKSKGNVDFRILSLQAGYPVVTVLDGVQSTWNVGDEVLLTSTDYDVNHGEIRKIKEFISETSFKLDGELDYRHFGEIEHGVDMRGEVALLSRNIRVQGVMGPCGATESCDLGYSMIGGHIKVIHSFGSVVIDGADLRLMGQSPAKGFYPIHFHMCANITGKTAIVRQNVIRDSYWRAVTVHGTYGTSENVGETGVVIESNVAHNIFGHAYFLEDGAELATVIYGNLASRVKNNNNGFATDKSKASCYWITNPKVVLVNNVATGCDGMGFWYTFPLSPVGPSSILDVYSDKEAKRTPLWTFDNNVAHSNGRSGMFFDNILSDDNGNVRGCMNYEPVSDPLDPNSTPVKVQLTRFTGYKNLDFNMWIRGGLFEVIQMSSIESRRGLQSARASKQPQFVRKSIFIGQSTKNAEEAGYPDAVTPETLGRYVGYVVYDGPVYVSETYFDQFSFDSNDTYYSTAIGFKTKNKFFSSVTTSVKQLRFGFEDTVNGLSKRVFDGNSLEDGDLGFGALDGDETATLRDLDGSLARCPGAAEFGQIVKPDNFAITQNCVYRENWKMAICSDKYGKVKTSASLWSETPVTSFDPNGAMRRRRHSDVNDFEYEDHTGSHSTNFLTVLGNTEFYYEYQYSGTVFPKTVTIEGTGIERDYPLIVGLCLPAAATKEDLTILWASPDSTFFSTDSVRWVDSLAEVATDGMPRMFLDGRMLYVYLSSRKDRNTAWDAYDYYHCPGNFCPFVKVTLSQNLAYTPCFEVPAGQIGTDDQYATLPTITCDLPSAQPEADWGAGDTTLTSRDGNWGEWGQWSKCCNEADGPVATTTRRRLCDNPPKYGGGADCPGQAEESQACTTPCPVDGAWTNWSQWSDCSCSGAAVGTNGVYTRTRQCVGTSNFGNYCRGANEDFRECDGDCENQ